MTGAFRMPEIMGPGVALFDYDNDGDLDLFLVQGGPLGPGAGPAPKVNHVLYRNDSFLYREQFQSTQDLSGFIQEGYPAIQRMSRDFAQTLVSDMLESF